MYTVTLCMTNADEVDEYNCNIFQCFPAVEMSLDNEKHIAELVYEIAENLNRKFV